MFRIGTRGSKLALWQANNLKSKLAQNNVNAELVVIKTRGDLIQHLSFDKIEGKGFFTKEIEDALIANEIDVAVHSLKDLPTNMHPELAISGLSKRANPYDILIIHPNAVDHTRLLKLKKGASVGTSSIRRKVQLFEFDNDINLVDIRGNVPTRINKIREGEVDAAVLAAAGVDRLSINLDGLEVIRFNPLEFVPAPAQGVVAYQCRRQDKVSRSIIKEIHEPSVASCTNIERKILNLLDGGCQLPLGAYCTTDENGHYHCTAVLGTEVAKPLNKISHSQSTASGLAEYVVTQLRQS